MITEETFEVIKVRYGQRMNTVTIENLVAGIYLTSVKLSSGYSGLSSNDSNSPDSCTHSRSRGFGDFTPGKFKGQRVADLLAIPDPSCFIRIVQLAVMNALSAELIEESTYRIIENLDPIELINLSEAKQVCVVGAFLSYIKKIADSKSVLKIIELNQDAVPEEFRQYFVPVQLAKDVLLKSDVIIITGSSLANNTLDDLLEIIPRKSRVMLVGPTSSLIPDVLFTRGVDVIGATRITDADKMLELVAEGAAGFHLFKSCAIKICLVNES